MVSSRLPRFKRSALAAPMRVTERDRKIIRLVHQNRFLRSSHIVALLEGSSQQMLRRLQLLYHHGFLVRPPAQIEYYRQGGSRHLVYGLGNRGAAILKEERDGMMPRPRWNDKNRSVGRLFLEHALLVSDVMVSLELACRKHGSVRPLTGDDIQIAESVRSPRSFRWRVKVNGRLTLGIIPDRVFVLEMKKEDGGTNRAFFFLECDRGTMPVMRKNLVQSSFYRKLLAYEATWASGLHRSRFGVNRFRVVTVTTSVGRVESIVEACSQLKRGRGIFLFLDQAAIEEHGDILTAPWKTVRSGETATLLP